MASIVKRKNKYSVVYTYQDEKGEKRQKWETFATNAEAKKRKAEVEFQQESGTLVIPEAKTVALEFDLVFLRKGIKGKLCLKATVLSERNRIGTRHSLTRIKNCIAGVRFLRIKNTLDRHSDKAIVKRFRVLFCSLYIGFQARKHRGAPDYRKKASMPVRGTEISAARRTEYGYALRHTKD